MWTPSTTAVYLSHYIPKETYFKFSLGIQRNLGSKWVMCHWKVDAPNWFELFFDSPPLIILIRTLWSNLLSFLIQAITDELQPMQISLRFHIAIDVPFVQNHAIPSSVSNYATLSFLRALLRWNLYVIRLITCSASFAGNV